MIASGARLETAGRIRRAAETAAEVQEGSQNWQNQPMILHSTYLDTQDFPKSVNLIPFLRRSGEAVRHSSSSLGPFRDPGKRSFLEFKRCADHCIQELRAAKNAGQRC